MLSLATADGANGTLATAGELQALQLMAAIADNAEDLTELAGVILSLGLVSPLPCDWAKGWMVPS